nr:EOG090X072S [Cyclestheria hislopi]
MVMHNADIPKSFREEGKVAWFGQLDDSEDEFDDDGRIMARSLGNGNDDFGARRRRLNTVVRLEKMRKEQQAAAMIKTIRWKEPEIEVHEEITFRKKGIAQKRTTSALSQLIADHASEPDSPYLEYAKFDGQSQLGIPTRTIRIFLNMQSIEERNYPMTVCVVASAKVSELIGLVCYKYNLEKREPPLCESVNNYALFIAEDDGSPDVDFPSLEPKETVGKFGFTTLALVRIAKPKAESPKEADVEKKESAQEKIIDNPENTLESTDFNTFKGFLLHKVRPKTEVTLGISWDQVEIKPNVTSRSSVTVATFLWPRPNIRPMQLPMEVVVDCIAMETIPSTVAIMYYHTEKRKWRRIRIECDSKTVEQVIGKLKFILEIRGGHYRQEYLQQKSSHVIKHRHTLPH